MSNANGDIIKPKRGRRSKKGGEFGEGDNPNDREKRM